MRTQIFLLSIFSFSIASATEQIDTTPNPMSAGVFSAAEVTPNATTSAVLDHKRLGGTGDIIVNGEYLHIFNGGSMTTWKVSDPSSLPTYWESFILTGVGEGTDRPMDTAGNPGNKIYAVGGNSISTIDISDPMQPVTEETSPFRFTTDRAVVTMTASAKDVVVVNNLAYIAGGSQRDQGSEIPEDWGNGLIIVDLSDPEKAETRGARELSGWSRAIAVQEQGGNTYAYVVDGKLNVFDVTDPTNPDQIASVTGPDPLQNHSITDVEVRAVNGRVYAYTSVARQGVTVFDVTVPSEPTIVGTYNTPGRQTAIILSGDYAYLLDGSSHELQADGIIRKIDVSNPAQLTLSSVINTDYYPWTATIPEGGDVGYVRANGLVTINTGDPAN